MGSDKQKDSAYECVNPIVLLWFSLIIRSTHVMLVTVLLKSRIREYDVLNVIILTYVTIAIFHALSFFSVNP